MDLERHDPGPAPGIRASDAERDRVVDLLRQHFADGRLTLEEFSERMDFAYQAKTRGELVTTLRDLPVLASHRPTPAAPPAGGHGHRPPLPIRLLPVVAITLLVIGLLISTRGLALWPLFVLLWIWNGPARRHRYWHHHRQGWTHNRPP